MTETFNDQAMTPPFRSADPHKAHVSRKRVVAVTALLFIAVLIPYSSGALPSADVIDTAGILKVLGFPGGKFDPVYAMDYQFDPATEAKVGLFDRDRPVDTVEEFLTALYFSPSVVGRKNRRELDRLLPPGREGGLRLCTLWLLKTADNPAYRARYRDAVHYIKKRSKLSGDEIIDFYEKKISGLIGSISTPALSPVEERELKEHLSLYMISPADDKIISRFTSWFLSLHKTGNAKSNAVISIVSEFSSTLADTLKKLILR